jgi:hypothetical protein
VSAVPFRAGREGVYANVCDSTILIRRTTAGWVVDVNGLAETTPFPTQKRALAAAQEIAQGVMSQSAHPAETSGADAAPETTTIQEDPMTETTDTTTETAAPAKPKRTRSTKPAVSKNTRAVTGKKPAPEKKPAAPAKPASSRDRILALHDEGKKVSEIATAVGVSQGRVRQILMDTGRIKVASRNPERDARIVAAIDAGEKPADVAEREGVKEFRVRWIYKIAKAGAA